MAKKNKNKNKNNKSRAPRQVANVTPAQSSPEPTSTTPAPPAAPISSALSNLGKACMALLLFGAAVGVFAGVYMTGHHEVQLYGGADTQTALIGCVESELISCDIVNTSDWSEFLGVPQFTWAIPMYLTIGVLAIAAFMGRQGALHIILVLGLWNTLYSVFLGYISYVELGKLCTWCLRLYAINLATPMLAVGAGVLRRPKPPMNFIAAISATFLVFTVISVGVQRSYRSTLLAGTPELSTPLAAAVESSASTDRSDPEGPAPTLSWEIQTEDKNTATLTIQPDDAWKGNPDAKVAVVEFADLECGYCKRASGQLKRLYDTYGDRVVFVFKHFPMNPACNPGVNNPKHRYACDASVAAVCAQEQGRFWNFHDIAFKNQHQLKKDDLLSYAAKAGVEMDEFRRCMASGAAKQLVRGDGEAGKALDIHGTPRIFINGKLYRAGSSAEQMAREIEVALGASAADASSAAKAMAEIRQPIAPIPADVPEMQLIEADGLSFHIDTFESSLVDGTAKSAKHQIPTRRMSWFAAEDACKKAGKRMCTEEEWVTACQGIRAIDDDADGEFADDMVEGNTYPYADYHDPRRCWDNKPGDKFRPVYTGEMPGCVTPQGVYDMTGNVEEWVGSSAESAVLIGGAWDTGKDHARCYRRNDTFGAGCANARTGFRCCK